MILPRARILFDLVAGAAAASAMIVGGGMFLEATSLPPRSASPLAALPALMIAIVVVWSSMHLQWTGRPDGSDRRKGGKQRS